MSEQHQLPPPLEKDNSAHADQLLEFMREAGRIDDQIENYHYIARLRPLTSQETYKLDCLERAGAELLVAAKRQGLI